MEENDNDKFDISPLEAKLDSIDQIMRQLLAEVSQLRSTIDQALD